MKNILCIIVCLIAINVHSQNIEIGVSGALGMSSLNFISINDDKPSFGIGNNFGLDVAFLLSKQLSFRTGVNFATYKSSVNIDRHNTRFELIPLPPGLQEYSEKFHITADYSNYEELYEAFFIRIPIMIQYQTGSPFYLAAGVMVGLPLNSFSQINADQLVTKGYSDYTMQEYENMPDHGFGSYPNIKAGSELDLGISISAALEAGFKWKIKNGMSLYTGIFADYGLNNIRKGDSMKESVILNEEESTFTHNSILHSQSDGKALTDKVQPVMFGVRLRVSK